MDTFQFASLGNGGDNILDAVSHCEQLHQEEDGAEGDAPWRLFIRKEMFAPWESAVLDPVATGLIFSQVRVFLYRTHICKVYKFLKKVCPHKVFCARSPPNKHKIIFL